MFKNCALAAFSLMVLSFNTNAATTQGVDDSKLNSIDKCVTLLPDNGHEYDFTISGVISKKKEFTGEFQLTDKTGKAMKKDFTKEEQDKLIPFQECIMKVTK